MNQLSQNMTYPSLQTVNYNVINNYLTITNDHNTRCPACVTSELHYDAQHRVSTSRFCFEAYAAQDYRVDTPIKECKHDSVNLLAKKLYIITVLSLNLCS